MRGRAAGLAAATLLFGAACQAPGMSTQPTAGPSAGPVVDAKVAAADRKFWSGDYDGAETDYQALAKAGTPGAASHYAVLLAYESRFKEAVTQARAGVEQKADSSSLARLTRALDWSNDVNPALAAGGKAIATKPVDPLAHVYYAEALADAGRFPEAERELHEAERASSADDYTRAEVFREWSNYYRDRSDSRGELNNIQLALKAQPKFPERTLELARYYYIQQKPDQAAASIQAAAKDSQSYGVLVAAGDSSLFAGDVATAAEQYVAAYKVREGGSAAALGIAEIAVAAQRDFKTAHDVLLVALKRDPSDSNVYGFLYYLDKLVLKIDAGAELNPIAPGAPAGLLPARQAALDSVNAYRQKAGLRPVTADPALAEAAEAHAWYTMFNLGQPSTAGLGIHTEDPTLPGFVAADPLRRDRAAGYQGTQGAEVINHVFTPPAAVAVWIDSVYHRYPLLDREATVVGYGEASVGVQAVAVMDVGIGPAGTGQPVVFPADGAADVPAAFIGHEVPDPAPQGTRYPVGYPVTLTVGSGSKLTVSASRLTGPDGKDMPGYALQPDPQHNPAQWAFMAKDPLKPGATYTVEVNGQLDGQPFSKRWSFTVTGG